MISACTVTTDGRDVVIVIADAGHVAHLPIHFPLWVADGWIERYARRFDNYRLPKEDAGRNALATQIGQDGAMLLDVLRLDPGLQWMTQVPAVEILRQMWIQQFMGSSSGEILPTFRYSAQG